MVNFPKSTCQKRQLTKNINESILVALCLEWIFGKLTFCKLTFWMLAIYPSIQTKYILDYIITVTSDCEIGIVNKTPVACTVNVLQL